MRPERSAQRILSITRAKAKMYEYAVPLEDHINLTTNPNVLFSLAMGLVGDAAAAIASGRPDDPRRSSSLKEIRFAATFFDAYINAQLNERVRDEFALLAACSYYLADLPGNARLLVSRIAEPSAQGADGLDWLTFKLLRSSFDLADTDIAQRPRLATALLSFQLYQTARDGPEPPLEATQTLRSEAYDAGDGRAVLYGDLVAAIAKKKIATSARTVLPAASDLPVEVWAPVLQKAASVTELWPAQMRICDAGLLRGHSAVVQMPTSAGKTRATELIIRSAFLANRTSLAVIVSPFRALCHDIRAHLANAFSGETIGINEATDAFQLDLTVEELLQRKTVLIVTPEKLLYILRRTPELAQQIGLIIYDEGHQFDSPGRGAVYELLLTSLKLLLAPRTQTVLLSAVISNAAQVAEWLVGDTQAVVTGNDLTPTTRSVAFATWATRVGQLLYVTPSDLDDLEFFVPRVIESVNLGHRPRERTDRFLPLKGSGTSVGLYLGLKVVRNGSVAVFCGRKDTAANLCETATEWFDRGYEQPPPLVVSDEAEVRKLVALFSAHMGSAAPATRAAALAIFPHHANVPHGLRLSVEHAMKEALIRFVVCTSTLAQGVNLPIKYLIITGVYQGSDRILVRDFHNLIGRAGRAGMHTEGSVIFAETDIYDKRLDRVERWRWRVAKDLLNPANSEPSASSILLLFSPFEYARPVREITLQIPTAHNLVFDEQAQIDRIVDQSNVPPGFVRDFRRYLSVRARIIQTIASFLLAHLDFESPMLSDDADILCSNTLAYHLASQDQRASLQLLFHNIALFVAAQAPTEELRLSIRRSALSPTAVTLLTEWLTNNLTHLVLASQQGTLFTAIIEQVLQHTTNDALSSLSDPRATAVLAGYWMEGRPFSELLTVLQQGDVRVGGRHSRPKVENLVEICESGFGYDGAMLVSTMADLVEPLNEELSAALFAIHKRFKYGLPSQTAVVFYELGFADRIVSMALAALFPQVHDRAMAMSSLRSQRNRAEAVIDAFPSYFAAVFAELIGP